ncbi:hypothetical protein F4604DRAFT_1683365 [Suillus subluteus]|nr:hypothetical protein F4604DRAFT_1683365 [Suillus subluteus]
MGRPKFYSTPEEQRDAKQMHRQVYYARNKVKINAKLKAKYRQKQADALPSPPSTKATGDYDDDTSHLNPDKGSTEHVHCHQKTKSAQKQDRLSQYLGGPPGQVIDTLVRDLLETGDLDKIRGTLSALEVIIQELYDTEQYILGREGMGQKLLKASARTCYFDKSMRGILSKQAKLLLLKMAPRKWTTAEQEDWLAPWYEKYHAKQADKVKNWSNFFADLNKDWFDMYPEPRLPELTPIGPLSEEETSKMEKAKQDRKEQLRNRFKNSMGATKTGWQAKAEATDVFNAVLQSVARCKKPTCSLQESEAYSRLYYQTRVKATVDEVLKAEAELLQGENKTLTNGKHVAIVKQYTASLYNAKTDEIKAEVQRYIANQKIQKDDEVRTLWSEDDYARNLQKLATIANKFLKGLAEATRFSFSLLAGGPSPECSGSIDVYSFHVGHTKLRNDFRSTLLNDLTGLDDACRQSVDTGSELFGVRAADKSGLPLLDTSSGVDSQLPFDSAVGQNLLNFSENSTAGDWNLDDDNFWADLTAKVATFNASSGNPTLPCLPPCPPQSAPLIMTPTPSLEAVMTSPEVPVQLPGDNPTLPCLPPYLPQSAPLITTPTPSLEVVMTSPEVPACTLAQLLHGSPPTGPTEPQPSVPLPVTSTLPGSPPCDLESNLLSANGLVECLFPQSATLLPIALVMVLQLVLGSMRLMRPA